MPLPGHVTNATGGCQPPLRRDGHIRTRKGRRLDVPLSDTRAG